MCENDPGQTDQSEFSPDPTVLTVEELMEWLDGQVEHIKDLQKRWGEHYPDINLPSAEASREMGVDSEEQRLRAAYFLAGKISVLRGVLGSFEQFLISTTDDRIVQNLEKYFGQDDSE